jgi:protein N-terminal amidase
MNWLKADEVLMDGEDEDKSGWQKVSRTINYFAMRLRPLFRSDVVFVAANRVGTEQVRGADETTTFTGSSCILVLGDTPTVECFASQDQEELIMGIVSVGRRKS